MRGKKAKKYRRWAERETVGKSAQETRDFYRKLKKVYG
jgi:hypothetical protein